MKTVPADATGLAIAARAIRSEQIVVYPTETVYGLGANPFSEAALGRLFAAKERDPANPVLLIVADLEQLRQVVASISNRAMECVNAFWPGPLSLLFPKAAALPDTLASRDGRVCARCPGLKIARDLCAAVGSAITSTSANRSGEAPARSLADVRLSGIEVGVDGGTLSPSPPSTVFDPDSGRVLREGAIAAEELLKRLK